MLGVSPVQKTLLSAKVNNELKRNHQQFFTVKDTVSFSANLAVNNTSVTIRPLKLANFLIEKVKRIKLSSGTDKTVKGFFNVVNNKIKYPKSVEINGEDIKLPDFEKPKDCAKWWKKHIGAEPLSTSKEDKKRARVLTKLPSLARTKLLATLPASVNGKPFKLTVYDNKELIDYRRKLNQRRIAIRTSTAVANQQGKNVINAVTDAIYDKYANSGEGIKYDKKLIVMIGQKAAGKTTLVNEMRQKYGVVVADSDEIREFIGTQETELHGLIKSGVKNAMADRAIIEGANYLAQFHGTGTAGALDLIKKFRKAGYDIEIQNMEVPENKLVERIIARKEKSDKDADPLAVILCGMKEQLENFNEIVKKTAKKAKGKTEVISKRFNNDVPYGTRPIEIKE